jgi:ribosomal-protein-alanine N-acetyltransferase
MTDSALILETPRLTLRPFRLSDADAFFSIFGDPEVFRHTARSKTLADVEAARAWLAREAPLALARGFGHWALLERSDGQLIGSCGLGAVPDSRDLELGFTIAPSRWGRGYASEIALACARHGLERLRAPRIVSLTSPTNLAAQRVLEKIGMRYLRDEWEDGALWLVYALEASSDR